MISMAMREYRTTGSEIITTKQMQRGCAVRDVATVDDDPMIRWNPQHAAFTESRPEHKQVESVIVESRRNHAG